MHTLVHLVFKKNLEVRQAQFLTTFFAENKEKFSSTILDISIDVCHETN